MCQNVFKSNEEKERRETFTRLFATLVSNCVKEPEPVTQKQPAGR